MGTPSFIIVHKDDGWWYASYCHYDGYVEHNGRILLDHYNNQRMAEALSELGDLSVLQPKVDCPPGHSFDHPVPGYCISYVRDRGDRPDNMRAETCISLQSALNFAKASFAHFIYVWTDGHWLVGKDKSRITDLKLLSDVLS